MCTDSGTVYNIPQWYAQPMKIKDELIQPIIDPHHVFVNNRVRCCSAGMNGMGISSKAWLKVAEHNKENKTGFSEELVKELRDKQSNGAAMSPDKRLEAMLNMRNKLLQYLRVGQFPPPGFHVAGMPMAQYEGLLTNVDRRLQLNHLVQQGTYNQRAISSLD